MTDLPDWMATMHSRAAQSRSPLQTAIQAPAIPYRNAPRNRPPPRQMRPAEQRAMDPNAGVRRQAMGEINRRAGADLATMPRIPRGNQFAEAGSMALEGTGLPSVRRGAETLTGVARNPSQPNAPMRALGGLGELGLGVLGAATFGEVGAMRPRPAPRSRFDSGTVWLRGTRDAPTDEFRGPEFMTTDRFTAERYGGQYGELNPDNVVAYHASADNRLTVNARGARFDSVPVPRELRGALGEKATTDAIAQAAREAGYDGVVFRRILDGGSQEPIDVFAALSEQGRRRVTPAPATIGEFGGVRPRGRVPMRGAPSQRAPAAPQVADAWEESSFFHGSPSQFDTFDANASPSPDRYGAFLSPRREISREYGENVRELQIRSGQYITPGEFNRRLDDYVKRNRVRVSTDGREWPQIRGDLMRQLERDGFLGIRGSALDEVQLFNPARDTRAIAPPPSDPEALSLARSWIDSFGGGPSAEARAIEVMREHMQEARNPAWRQRLADAIDSVDSRAYVQGERTSFSQRVEEAWPDIYGGAATPDPSPPLTRPPTQIAPNGMPIRPPQPFRNSLRGGNDDLAEAARMRDRGERP